ncbi:MAG: hypothetical protein E7205_09015 [Tissierellaceae bacterium]|nr:hypothetical protein [Tissierellaceae bacterium]
MHSPQRIISCNLNKQIEVLLTYLYQCQKIIHPDKKDVRTDKRVVHPNCQAVCLKEFIKMINNQRSCCFKIFVISEKSAKLIGVYVEIIYYMDWVKSIYPEESEVAMTLVEKLRKEGEERELLKGMEKGLELGTRQSKIEVARKLVKMDMKLEQIVYITGLPYEEVKKIAKKME